MTGAQLSLRSLSDASYAASSNTGAMNSASASSGGRVNVVSGQEREGGATQREKHRIRRADTARGSGEDDRGNEQPEQLFEFTHADGGGRTR